LSEAPHSRTISRFPTVNGSLIGRDGGGLISVGREGLGNGEIIAGCMRDGDRERLRDSAGGFYLRADTPNSCTRQCLPRGPSQETNPIESCSFKSQGKRSRLPNALRFCSRIKRKRRNDRPAPPVGEESGRRPSVEAKTGDVCGLQQAL